MNSQDKTHAAPRGIALKVRLTLWYGIALGVILAIFAGTLYMVLARGLKDQVDRSLEEAATVAVKALEERRVGPYVRFDDLVDEFHLMVFPIALGSGKRLFADGTVPAAFTGADVKTSNNGVIIATYQRAGAVKYGSFAPEESAAAEVRGR